MKYTRPSHFLCGEPGFHHTYDATAHLYERLSWQYGPERALSKIKGEDPESKADEAAWRRLCALGRPNPAGREKP